MKRNSEIVAVTTCDIVNSSKYSAQDRSRVQKLLLSAWKDAETKFRRGLDSELSFRVTAGDEFQFVCLDAATAFDCLTLLRIHLCLSELRPRVTFRASVGLGARNVKGVRNPYTQDGPAFHAAREGMNSLKHQRRLTIAASSDSSLQLSGVNALLRLTDRVYAGWTSAQARVLRVALAGATGEDIARRLKITRPTVSRHLYRAEWEEYSQAFEEIKRQLSE